MPVPQQALDLIKHFEGCQLTAYKDAGGVLTIGVGHTGPDVTKGLTITQDEADALLADDAQKACDYVNGELKVEVNENQLAALVSLVFNIGEGAFGESTLLALLNRGWYSSVPAQLAKWTHVHGLVLNGLVKRRQAEADLWNTPLDDTENA